MVPRYKRLMAASSVIEGKEDGNPEQKQSLPPYRGLAKPFSQGLVGRLRAPSEEGWSLERYECAGL